MPEHKPSLGFVGLGLMGTPIALRLLAGGHRMQVWGRTAAKLAPALDAGAVRAPSAAQLAAASDVVFLCVTDTPAVEAVVFGEQGVAAGAGPGKILVDHSSIEPAATRAMAARLREQTGMAWLDAPVSGGAPAAEQGTLAVMAGGDPEVFERVRPVVERVAGRFTLMGPSGAGQATKLVNQVLVGCNFLVLAEATRLAQNAGVDAERIPAALRGGRADSRLLQEYMPRMARGDLSPLGRIDVMLKDLQTVQDLARTTGTAMPLTGLTTELHRLLVGRGLGAADNGAVMQLYGDPEPQ